jgi:hypothetical protein
VAREDVGEDTKRSYSVCLREILQNASRKERKKGVSTIIMHGVGMMIDA